jgi:SAM-dependent methyltransferase
VSPMDLKEVGLLGGDEGSHWYYASKARALQRCLVDRQPEKILDVGAGSGFFSKMLLRQTTARSAICVDPGYAVDRSEIESGKPIAFTRFHAAGEADLILLMDVLEHVDDDVGLLRTYAESARPGTRFVVSVPAFSWLWSAHDEFLEHRRRYTLNQTLRVLSRAGLSPVTGFYFFAALFPGSDLRQHHWLTNSILIGVCQAECLIARHNRAFGLTAFGVAEKT